MVNEQVGPIGLYCLCMKSPRDVEGQALFRCMACFNSVLEEKNRLVRENYDLLEKRRPVCDSCSASSGSAAT